MPSWKIRSAGAIAFAQQIVAGGAKFTRVRDREDKIAATRRTRPLSRPPPKPRSKNSPASKRPPPASIRVRNAFTLPFDDGIAAERALFMKLVTGDQSRAQRHIFFSRARGGEGAGRARRHQTRPHHQRRRDRRRHHGRRHRHVLRQCRHPRDHPRDDRRNFSRKAWSASNPPIRSRSTAARSTPMPWTSASPSSPAPPIGR